MDTTSIHTIAIKKTPKFFKSSPSVWILGIEAHLSTTKMSQAIKFDHVLVTFEPDVIAE